MITRARTHTQAHTQAFVLEQSQTQVPAPHHTQRACLHTHTHTHTHTHLQVKNFYMLKFPTMRIYDEDRVLNDLPLGLQRMVYI